VRRQLELRPDLPDRRQVRRHRPHQAGRPARHPGRVPVPVRRHQARPRRDRAAS
jgi:hypothetical protein